MARKVDEKKTRKALRRLKRVAESQGDPKLDGAPLTPWEKDFVEGVSQRLETYGSAFRDPQKGALDEPLSARQAGIVRALQKKRRAKSKPGPVGETKGAGGLEPETRADSPRGGIKRKSAGLGRKASPPRVRDINDDLPTESATPADKRPPAPGRSNGPRLKAVPATQPGEAETEAKQSRPPRSRPRLKLIRGGRGDP
ncbi:hypothetical protein GC169_06720 [bacterium]|nr:hypothetical protein [bacterium]